MKSIIDKYKDILIEQVRDTVHRHFEKPNNDTYAEQIRGSWIELPDGYSADVDIDLWGCNYSVNGGYENPSYDEGKLEYSVLFVKVYNNNGELVEAAKNVEWLKGEEEW